MLLAMIRGAASVLLACLLANAASAVNCATVTAAKSAYTVCRVNLREQPVRLYYANQGQRLESFEALRALLERRGEILEFAMNAGMFHPDFRTVGLLIVDGQTIAPLNRSWAPGNFFLQPNGVFIIKGNVARVLATDDYGDQRPDFATQSGPMLVHHGQIPNLRAFNAASDSRHLRNGVCAQTPEIVAFVISEDEVTFHQFARFFQRDLGCSEALYFDGSISSLYAPQLKRADDGAKLGPMVGVVK